MGKVLYMGEAFPNHQLLPPGPAGSGVRSGSSASARAGTMWKPGGAAASGCPQHLQREALMENIKSLFFKNSYIFLFFNTLQGTKWGLEASKGKKAGDAVRTWGHVVHCEVEVLFPPLVICQTDGCKELQNQEMSDKYRKALKSFVIKQK